MTTKPSAHTLGPLVRAAGADPTDGDLVGRFVGERDEGAFAALVRRHGPMVWGVCRRVLPSEPDAEDAFQATFLILALKAASVDPPGAVGNWLYGVARTTALKARRTNRRRAGHERPVAVLPEPEAVPRDDRWDDLLPLLDRELSRLPDRYRSVLVLCDLEGVTRRDAARRLGLPEGTVNSRLSRARTFLAGRLTRHGVALSAGALAAVLSRHAAASVPAAVASATVRVAVLATTRGAVTAGAASANVAALTHGVGQAMLATKLKLTAAALLLLGTLGLGYGLAGGTGTDARRGSVANESERERPPASPTPEKTDKPPEPPMKAHKDEKPDLVRGVVKEVGADAILLAGGERVSLDAKTEYLRETGFDAAPAKLADVTPGTRVYIGTKKHGGKLVAVTVVIEPPQPKAAEKNKNKPADDPKPAGDPDAVMKAMDGFRKTLPEPQGLAEMNGTGVADIDGVAHPDSHLAGVAARLGVRTQAECVALMTYLKDPDPKMRRIAAFAVEGVVKAYPNGMSSDDMQAVDSDGHRKMVKAFIVGIEKLPK